MYLIMSETTSVATGYNSCLNLLTLDRGFVNIRQGKFLVLPKLNVLLPKGEAMNGVFKGFR
jgi:hypothetical protein